jgi:transposase
MSRLIILTLTDEERIALEKGSRHGTSHAFRTRCQMILLKADRLPSAQVAQQIGCCMIAVNGWVKRYQTEGIRGLKTKQGRGRKAILDDHADTEQVRTAVQNHRQKISLAKAELETSLGKEFSTTTLKRFLKNIAAATRD